MFTKLLRKIKAAPDDPIDRMLRLDAPTFVSMVKDWVHSAEPAAATMCVVALRNFDVILKFASEHATKNSESGPQLDQFIRFLSNENEERDERNRRRLHWFLWAALVRRATLMAEHETRSHDDAAAIWVRLAEGGKFLAVLLEQNVIWDADEKLWFDFIKTQREGASYVVSHMSPKWLRSNDRINAFASAHDFFVVEF